MPPVTLLGFAPDLDPATPGAIIVCSQFEPSRNGMRAAASAVATSFPALSEASQGSALLIKLDGSTRFFSGGAAAIQEGTAGVWSDVSRGGGYSASGGVRWRFAQFGNDSVAANKTCALQRSTGSAFANLTAPKAALVETVSGFVLVADWDDTGMGLSTTYGNSPNGWWCSAINDVATWTPSLSTQATRGFLVDAPGPCLGLRRLGPNAVIYKERAIFLGTYVGAQQGVFRWDLIPGDIGCSSNEAVVSIGTAHLFIGGDDIYMFDGSRPIPIGGPIRSWFFDRLNKDYRDKMAGTHDRVSGLVRWYYPSTNSADGSIDSCIVYDYRTQRWGVADQSIEVPIEIVLDGITYDNLGTLFSTYADLPDITYDSPFWIAGSPVPAVIGADHTPYTLGGVPGDWSFQTWRAGGDGQVSLVTRVTPRWLVQPAAGHATMTEMYARAAAGTLSDGRTANINATRGHFDVLRAAEWHSFEFNGDGYAELSAIDVAAQDAGYQ